MPAEPDAVALATTVSRAADEKDADDLAVLDVADILGIVDLFVLASARTERQMRAVAEEVERVAREHHGRRPLRREGTFESGWYLLDFGDVVCHVFDPESRGFFALERLWGDVARRDPATGELLEPDRVAVPARHEATG